MQSIFMTGASGSVGHYLVDILAPDYQLYLLVRNRAKLRFDPDKYPNVKIIDGDLDSIPLHSEILSRVEYCIHVATAWGGEGTERINVDRVHQMFDLLNPAILLRVIYFSTASILGRGNVLLPDVAKYGTDYIKTKYKCYTKLPNSKIYNRIVTVFPTVIFGGDLQHPATFPSEGINTIRRFSWLIGRINLEGIFFHFIHAQDIARIVRYLLEKPEVEKNYVLGNSPVSFSEFTKRAVGYFGRKINWQFKLSPAGICRLGAFLGVKISAWDRFCANYKDFRYQTINCASLGLPSDYSSLEEIMADWRVLQK